MTSTHFSEKRELEKVLEIAKERVQLKSSSLIREAEGNPVMFIYAADGTPMRVKKSVRQPVPHEAHGAKRFARSGFQRQEYLCQRGYFKTFDSEGKPQVSCLVADHKPLDPDAKDSWAL